MIEPKNRLITLLSDFGLEDIYVGVMKGAIARINPSLKTIDLTHQIPPQNLAAGRFALMEAVPYFPRETVHVAVVDPGVGSRRRGVAIQFASGYLVGPDNGLFSGILSLFPIITAVELTNPKYWRTENPSKTFHGRDIFAPVGAYLASGVAITELGNSIDPHTLVQLPMPQLQITEREIFGCVQYIDRFGNLITNIPGAAVEGKSWSVRVGDLSIASKATYNDVAIGEIVALVASHGWVEIAVNSGSAKSRLQLDWLNWVTVSIDFT